jgi:hypothetical protein
MNQTAFDSQFNAFLDLLGRPEGAFGIAGLIVLMVAVVVFKQFKWYALAMLLWTTTLAFVIQPGTTRLASLLPPFEQLRSQSRPICVAMLLILAIPTFMSPRGWRTRILGIGVLAMFFFQMMLAVRVTASETSRGVASLFIYPLMFIPLGIGLSRWLQDWKDAHAMLRAFVICGLLFFGGSALHLLVTPGTVVHNHRLYGTCGNPQLAAAASGACIPVICYFIVRHRQRWAYRLFLCALVGFLIIMLIWTGSRTGLLMTTVAVVMLFRARIGRLALAGITVGIFVMLALQIYTESTATFTDMFMRGDTRSHVWTELLSQFREHVMWGSMSNEIGVRENSYLWVAAGTGLWGVIPMLMFMAAVAWQLFKLQRIRRYLGENALLADLATGGMAALGVACMFEGYIAGTMTLQVISAYVYLALTTFLIDAAGNIRAQQAMVLHQDDESMAAVGAPDEYAGALAYAHTHPGYN